MTEPIGEWKRVRSEPGPDLIILRARFDWYLNPRNSKLLRRVVLQASDWVNIVALTKEKKIVTVRQFRFGAGHETTEIPAGMVDEGEAPEAAARRELEEETGYSTEQWQYLGWIQPNPAFLDNRCHTFLASEVVKTGEPRLDEGEDIQVQELTLDQVKQEMSRGAIRNALAVVALGYIFDLRGIVPADPGEEK
ncbi:MAG: NUDIX hydrolase [Rudaea sp.]